MDIKRILREEINTKFTEKLFNKLKNFVSYHPVTKVDINIPGFSFNDKRQGINITVRKDGWVGSKVREAIRTGYGATEEESEVVWDKLRIYLKKLSFVESIGWVIYEDWLRYESDPYYVDGYNIRNLNDFIEYLDSLDMSFSSYDTHSEETINFFPMLDRGDFEYIHNEVLKMIENDGDWYGEHLDESRRIKKILSELGGEYDDEEEEDIFTKDMYGEKVYQKIFRVFDKHVKSDPNKIFDILKNLNLKDEDIDTGDLEANLVYKYLTEYKDRTNAYLSIYFTPSGMASFFCDDRDYDIRKMVEGYFNSDWDYGYYQECYDFDDYYFDRIDQQNLDLMEEHYLKDLEGEPSEEDFKEFVESEFGDDIGCAASDAQYSADIDVLHSDFEDGILDYLSKFNGKLQPPVDEEGNKGIGLEYVGEVELGDIASSEHFKDFLHEHLSHGYPSFDEILDSILEEEKDGWSSQYNYFYPEDCISINTDKHFRYGGAGNIDWSYFNEILNDRLSYY